MKAKGKEDENGRYSRQKYTLYLGRRHTQTEQRHTQTEQWYAQTEQRYAQTEQQYAQTEQR